MTNGVVVVYAPDDPSGPGSHERVTRTRIAERLAALQGFDFAGEYEPFRQYPGALYFVPGETLVGIEAARELGIQSERDLFGGVVPHAFVATKTITHPLVDDDAHAPAGWSPLFAHRVHDVVLPGFSVFGREDATRAGARLLECGPLRIKPARASGGRGQSVVATMTELETALDAIDEAELSTHGLVFEENLVDVITFGVGQVRVADLAATYYGTQRLTPDNSGAMVYGGSDLIVVRGGFDALLGSGLPSEARLAVEQALVYDTAAREHFPGMFASRRNYDIAQGLGNGGRRRSGVMEQSWRLGGASGAEIAALEAFRAAPSLRAVRASSVEIFGDAEAPPPHATIYFRGRDEQVGPITKYAWVERHVDTR